MMGRRVEIQLMYEDTDVSADIAGYLTDFSYSDNGDGQADDLQITLQDRFQLWQGEWMGKKGDEITAQIKLINWYGDKQTVMLPCGRFTVDSFDCSGPPDIISIKSVSIPINSDAKNEKKTKAWENVTLQQIAKDIASSSGLSLMYRAEENPKYDRMDQTRQSNLAFLLEIARKEGISVKVTDKKLVLYDDALLERNPPIKVIKRGVSHVLSYSFNSNSADCSYSACEVAYYDSKTKKNIKYTFKPKGAPEGPVLKINDRVKTKIEAERLAKKSLREKNKEAITGRFVLVGDPQLVQGVTIEINGWKNFDGKYFIVKANHRVSNGYTVDIEIRKALNY